MHVNDGWEPRTPVEGVMHAFSRVGRRLKAKQPGDTIDHSAHLVLFALRCNGALRLSELANRLEIDASTASRHIRGLEQLGLVRRSADPADRRAFRVELTDEGAEAWESAAQRRMETLAQAMEGWSEEDVRTFERLMTRFADGVTSIVDARSAAAPKPSARSSAESSAESSSPETTADETTADKAPADTSPADKNWADKSWADKGWAIAARRAGANRADKTLENT